MNRPDDELDNLFRNHLAGELDPMRGQAARAFDREVTRPMRRRLRLHAFRGVGRRVRHAAPMLLSMAACTALGFYVPRWLGTTPAATEIADVTPRPADTTVDAARNAIVRPEGFDLPAWQTNIESARFVDPQTHARTEFILIPAERDGTPTSARQ